jgi:hypothetical protein
MVSLQAQFSLGAVTFLDDPYLDPFTNGVSREKLCHHLRRALAHFGSEISFIEKSSTAAPVINFWKKYYSTEGATAESL